jgi:MFS family permease
MSEPASLQASPGKKLYYGWIIAAVLAAANAVGMGLATLNMGLFVKPMGDDLGISRADFGWASSVRSLAGAATSPFIGRLVDRYGVRWLLALTTLLGGGAVIALAWIVDGWQLIGLFAFMGLIGVLGPTQLTTTVPVLKWFVRKRAKAVAVMSVGVPIGALIFLPLSQYLIDDYGWRTAWVVLGVIGVTIVVPLSLIFMRREPEDLGLLPDGAAPAVDSGTDNLTGEPAEVSWTAHQAVRSRVFWQLAVVVSIVMFAISTMTLHRLPAFIERGIDPTWVAWSTTLDAILFGVATFLLGTFAGHIPSRYLGAGGFVLMAVSAWILVVGHSVMAMLASMSLFGLGIGGMMYMQNIIWADYFGRVNLGAIRGLVNPVTMIMSALGAPIAGYVYDVTGSYEPVWWASVGLMLLGAVLIVATPPPAAASRSHVEDMGGYSD